ncbi:MAG: GNAT family N-acetyltransferase [Planctomycetia bacterium]|nr:GNAT family N-acetyltransferase [Planctomycetia bacterium]
MSFGLPEPQGIEIRTPRLVLRPLTFADVPALFEAVDSSRSFLSRFLDWVDSVRGEADLRVFVDRCQRKEGEGEAHRGLFEPDGRLAGHMSVKDAVPSRKAAELGYWVREDRAGRGYATEAARALLAWSFRNLDLHRVTAFADTFNPASARVLEKCGFAREGVVRHRILHGDAWRDHAMFGLLAGELKL